MSKPNVNVKSSNIKSTTVTAISATIKSNIIDELVGRRETLLNDAELLQKTIDFLKKK